MPASEAPLSLLRPVADADDEADLIRRARDRDQQAFAQLYRRHAGRVHALCRRMAAALPPRARVAFVLRDIKSCTHGEIARLLELEPGTGKAQLHRARQLLQESLR